MDINAIERQSSTPGLISGTMLVIATVVGGGMFSLPIAMAGVWFPGASVILLFIAIMMLLTGLMLVEVNLHYGAGASFNTFTQDLLGRKWNIVVGIAFGFVLYILTYAYISGSSAVMAQTVFKYSGVTLSGEYLGGDRQYAGRRDCLVQLLAGRTHHYRVDYR